MDDLIRLDNEGKLVGHARKLAARIEELTRELDGWQAAYDRAAALRAKDIARADTLAARLKEAEGALKLIDSISVHSGGEMHGVTAIEWRQGLEFAQRTAADALARLEEPRT